MEPSTENEERGKPQDKLIVVVDDDQSIRDLIEMLVKAEGFRCETAGDGEVGIKLIQDKIPDLVLLDLMLPRYGGFEILRQLQTGDTARVPIVIVTGRYSDRTTVDMIKQESNVVDFVEKPINTKIFGLNLHKLLKTSPIPK
jgi:DNA-binding response OmpR family regulator